MSSQALRDGEIHRLPYALGLLLLGAVGFVFRDFALQWQPVSEMLPHRTLFASLNATLLCIGAIALMTPLRRFAGQLLAGYLSVWVLLLHGPRIAAKPFDVATWLGAAEIAALAVGGLALSLIAGANVPRSKWNRVLRYGFATCVGVFGLSHFVYAQFTASLVPAWIPGQLFWAYATGAAHLAACVSLFAGVLVRSSTVLLTAMLAIITLAVQVPRIIANPAEHADWVAFVISTALTGAAWLVHVLLVPDADPAVIGSSTEVESTGRNLWAGL